MSGTIQTTVVVKPAADGTALPGPIASAKGAVALPGSHISVFAHGAGTTASADGAFAYKGGIVQVSAGLSDEEMLAELTK